MIKTHLAITRDQLESYPKDPDLTLEHLPMDRDFFFTLIELIGGEDGWSLRKEFNNSRELNFIIKQLESEGASLSIFRKDDKPIGAGICANIEQSLSKNFDFLAHANDQNLQEIYKVGLFPRFTRKGYGKFLIPALVEKLFNDGNEYVYLNTRDTNHVNSVPFYQRIGMQAIGSEELPDKPANNETPYSEFLEIVKVLKLHAADKMIPEKQIEINTILNSLLTYFENQKFVSPSPSL